MSYDFSAKIDLGGLASLTRSLQSVAQPLGIDYFLIGASARDLMLRFAHDIHASRATEDADFGVMVEDWSEFASLRQGLIASGEFTSRPGPATHRLRHKAGLPLDIVPFGGVEQVDGTVAWPGEGVVFDCFGMKEAFASCVEVTLPGNIRLAVASIPALTILKIAAWRDRKNTLPGRDAPDLLLFVRSYLDCGNFDRLAREHADLTESADFDYVEAGARLLARDIERLVGSDAIDRLLEILLPETNEEGSLLLAHRSQMDLETARRLLDVMCEEWTSSTVSSGKARA